MLSQWASFPFVVVFHVLVVAVGDVVDTLKHDVEQMY